MSASRQTWLVATRELKERSRSRAFRASLVLMILIVVGAIVAPSLLDDGGSNKKVGVVGNVPSGLAAAIGIQGRAADLDIDISRYSDVEAGRDAVRDGHINVLVVGGKRLEWQRRFDPELRAITVAAIQALSIRGRAENAGISPNTLPS